MLHQMVVRQWMGQGRKEKLNVKRIRRWCGKYGLTLPRRKLRQRGGKDRAFGWADENDWFLVIHLRCTIEIPPMYITFFGLYSLAQQKWDEPSGEKFITPVFGSYAVRNTPTMYGRMISFLIPWRMAGY